MINSNTPTSPWDRPDTVAGFSRSPPNAVLMAFVQRELERCPDLQVLDLGCGAARNAVPMAATGCRVTGIDASEPMLEAASARALEAGLESRVTLLNATMASLPFEDAVFDFVVAHGIWNLARSGTEFRQAVAEAARVSRSGAGLFVFTFSRHTLPDSVAPAPGETFVFTQFSGEPQCFLTEEQLIDELAGAGFDQDPPGPLTEYNRPNGLTLAIRGPVIYEGTFRRR